MIWEKIKWLFITFLKFKKTSYPRTLWGAKLCTLALFGATASLGVFNINFESGFVIDSLELTVQEASLFTIFTSIAFSIIGIALIYSEWDSKIRHTAKVFISAMPSVSNHFPDEVLDSTEKEFCRESVTLGLPQGHNENLDQQILRYNSELNADIFKRFILQEKCQRIYIGGLARLPILVAYGAFLRNVTSEIFYFDKFHRSGNWGLLSHENEKITLTETHLNMEANNSGDIGIALGMSTAISLDQIPRYLQKSITILEPYIRKERNLIKNQENLQEISSRVSSLIDQFSALPGCKRIHLFLSVQSTVAIELGRRFQEGTHKNWIIYNFNPSTNSYDWSLELSKNGIRKYELNQ